MACKGSGVQIPSAPPPHQRRSQACPSLQRRFLPLPDCLIRATRVPPGAGDGLSASAEGDVGGGGGEPRFLEASPARAGGGGGRAPLPPLEIAAAQQPTLGGGE